MGLNITLSILFLLQRCQQRCSPVVMVRMTWYLVIWFRLFPLCWKYYPEAVISSLTNKCDPYLLTLSLSWYETSSLPNKYVLSFYHDIRITLYQTIRPQITVPMYVFHVLMTSPLLTSRISYCGFTHVLIEGIFTFFFHLDCQKDEYYSPDILLFILFKVINIKVLPSVSQKTVIMTFLTYIIDLAFWCIATGFHCWYFSLKFHPHWQFWAYNWLDFSLWSKHCWNNLFFACIYSTFS